MIPILPLRLAWRLEGSLRLPRYAGSLWRSAIGASLRRHACVTGAKTCDGCPLLARCAYGFLFDTPQPVLGDKGLAQYAQIPHPYVLSPRHQGREHAANGELALDVILIGPGHRFLADLLTAIHALRLGPAQARLQRIAILPLQPGHTEAAETVTVARVLDAAPQTPTPPAAPPAARIVFEHPLRLRRNNQYLHPKDFDFRAFFTHLTRRISMLHRLCQASALQADFAQLKHIADSVTLAGSDLHWFDWHRQSARQNRRIPMGGLVGHIDVRGNLQPLWPWLWAGQWLHCGKGAVMGLGRYRIEFDA